MRVFQQTIDCKNSDRFALGHKNWTGGNKYSILARDTLDKVESFIQGLQAP